MHLDAPDTSTHIMGVPRVLRRQTSSFHGTTSTFRFGHGEGRFIWMCVAAEVGAHHSSQLTCAVRREGVQRLADWQNFSLCTAPSSWLWYKLTPVGCVGGTFSIRPPGKLLKQGEPLSISPFCVPLHCGVCLTSGDAQSGHSSLDTVSHQAK